MCCLITKFSYKKVFKSPYISVFLNFSAQNLLDFLWKNAIIVLYHSDGGNKEIIALHLSHNTKTRAKFQATREVESLVMHTTRGELIITRGFATRDD